MNILLNIALILILLIIVYQDLKFRLIHMFLPMLILILGIMIKWTSLNWIELFYSLLFLTLNFVFVTVYFSIKNKGWVNPFQNMIGIGDLLFLVALVPFFTSRNYILFFVMGMIFSLILYGVIKSIYRIENTIPLAGYLSIFMIGVLGINTFFDNNFLL